MKTMDTIKFRIGEKKYEIPSSWDECTFGQYIDIAKMRMTVKSDILRDFATIAILANDNSLKQFLFDKINHRSLQPLLEKLNWTKFEPDIRQFNKLEKDVEIEIEGIKYKLKADYNSLSNIELILIEELKESPKVIEYNLFELTFGVLFKRLNTDGTEVDVTPELIFDNINTFRSKIKMKDIYSILYFFLSGKTASWKEDSKSCSQNDLFQMLDQTEIPKKRKKKQSQKSLQSGDGMAGSSDLQTETYSK